MSLFIGLMSGTSADGMDAALVRFHEQRPCQLLDAINIPYSESFQFYLRTMALRPELPALEVMQMERDIAKYSVKAVQQLLERNQLQAQDIQAIGSHGHTLRHRPGPNGLSWQIGDPSWIAEHANITCVADFRRRDIAAGGEGAPLVPAFHAACFAKPCMVLNIGGIANLTVLNNEHDTIGFDTGPGNALIDEWCKRHFNRNYDKNGDNARSGQYDESLLNEWLNNPYFQLPPPKSTGRELFQLERLGQLSQYSTSTILSTLTELTARSAALAVNRFGLTQGELLICGGGVHNSFLLERLQAALPNHQIRSTATHNVDPDWLEAMAFAWLAWRTLNHHSGNLTAVTGARAQRILGGVYWA